MRKNEGATRQPISYLLSENQFGLDVRVCSNMRNILNSVKHGKESKLFTRHKSDYWSDGFPLQVP